MKPHPFNTNGAFRLATDAEARRAAMTGSQKGGIARASSLRGKRADNLLRKFD